ncbi:MAG TPA: SPOR domain-containing protein [Oxalicibacterium sp.]|nr:SPOR domain-containing protein [Oxalicibacterium sp.]HWV62977.1 SPOR domain-containing protein [Oxalicibacterium sp.]
MTNKNKQAGGTLLGLILGLVIGLGIAVGVALYVTKSSLPFTNKFTTPEKPMAAPSDLPDPNKALYGKKPTLPETGTDLTNPAANAGQPVPPTNTAINKNPAQVDAVKPGDDDTKYIYYLQAGAFRATEDAESLRAKLALLGFEAKVSDTQTDNGTLHRVRIGPFSQTEAMNRVRGKLSDNGVDVAVVRIGK